MAATTHKNWSFVINLGNSIIGVSVLAMPFCFKKCGIILGPLLLLVSSWLTQISCRLLMRAANVSKRRSYEILAWHTFGGMGKLAVEISIIGLLVGTCTAFHVIIGDLLPAIISKLFNIENTDTLRVILMSLTCLFVALPLSLLRSIDSLNSLSAISMSFYGIFVVMMLFNAIPNLWSGKWSSRVEFWRPEAIFQSLPIFSLAFACQTNLFVIYDALPDPSFTKMNSVITGAVTLVSSVYLLVGFFGYVAYYEDGPAGDVLLSFKPSFFAELLKLGFVSSVAISFPLVVYPCRRSIHSLLFSEPAGTHGNIGGLSVIPPLRFKTITIALVVLTLLVGIFIPNIEFVLGITGATMGTMICFIFPAVMYIQVVGKPNSKGKMYAQIVLFLGITILIASTYSTLIAQDKAVKEPPVKMPDNNVAGNNANQQKPVEDIIKKDVEEGDGVKKDSVAAKENEGKKEYKASVTEDANKKMENNGANAVGDEVEKAKRQEPANPVPPVDSKDAKLEDEKVKNESMNKNANVEQIAQPNIKDVVDIDKKDDDKKNGENMNKILKQIIAVKDQQEKLYAEQKEVLAEMKEHKRAAHSDTDADQVNRKEELKLVKKDEDIKKDNVNLLEKYEELHDLEQGDKHVRKKENTEHKDTNEDMPVLEQQRDRKNDDAIINQEKNDLVIEGNNKGDMQLPAIDNKNPELHKQSVQKRDAGDPDFNLQNGAFKQQGQNQNNIVPNHDIQKTNLQNQQEFGQNQNKKQLNENQHNVLNKQNVAQPDLHAVKNLAQIENQKLKQNAQQEVNFGSK